MLRIEMTEIHDHPRFPAGLRDLVTDALEALWEFGNSYRPILGLLHEGITASPRSRARVVDLCSGGGGPWLALARQLQDEHRLTVSVCLTDRYPNTKAFQRIADRSRDRGSEISFASEPINAAEVPACMTGFRTVFSSFHHFGPAQARELLASAVESGQGIGIFEVARRGFRTLLALTFTPFLVLWLTPGMRPFRWSRLLWTYLLPVVPFVIGYDGWVSCLRSYSQAELREMVRGIDGYVWKIGETRTGLLPVTYLIGYPAAQTAEATVCDDEELVRCEA